MIRVGAGLEPPAAHRANAQSLLCDTCHHRRLAQAKDRERGVVQERKALEQRVERLQKVIKCVAHHSRAHLQSRDGSCTPIVSSTHQSLIEPSVGSSVSSDVNMQTSSSSGDASKPRNNSAWANCRDRRAELDEAQLNLTAMKALSDEADLLRARVAELEPLQVINDSGVHISFGCDSVKTVEQLLPQAAAAIQARAPALL